MRKNSIMQKSIYTLSLCLLASFAIQAQEVLSFEQALSNTLKNNYNIQVSSIDEQVAENNAKRSANGYLPIISANGTYSWSAFQGNNETINGDFSYDANNSYNYSAGINATFTLFDGLGRKYRLQQNEGNANLSRIELRQVTENSILELSRNYYEVARLQQQSESLDSTLAISRARYLRANYGSEFGQSTQLEVLNAEVDYTNDSINLVNSLQLLENTKRSLNLSMGIPLDTEYIIEEIADFDEQLALVNVVDEALENSTAILAAKQINQNAPLGLGTSRSVWYPRLSINGGYSYRGSDDPNGAFLIGSNSYGPNAGVSLSWTIFDGANSTQVQNAKLQVTRSEITLEHSEQQVKMTAMNTHAAFKNALFVLKSREKVLQTAQQNFERSQEALAQGQITSVEFRQAQLNLLNAELQLSQSRYDIVNLELEIKALMGKLVN